MESIDELVLIRITPKEYDLMRMLNRAIEGTQYIITYWNRLVIKRSFRKRFK